MNGGSIMPQQYVDVDFRFEKTERGRRYGTRDSVRLPRVRGRTAQSYVTDALSFRLAGCPSLTLWDIVSVTIAGRAAPQVVIDRARDWMRKNKTPEAL